MTIDITPVKTIDINVATLSPEAITKANIKNVSGVYAERPALATDKTGHEEWKYKYDTRTTINIEMTDGDIYRFEAQDITNQPTWNGGAQADLQQAVLDIKASL